MSLFLLVGFIGLGITVFMVMSLVIAVTPILWSSDSTGIVSGKAVRTIDAACDKAVKHPNLIDTFE